MRHRPLKMTPRFLHSSQINYSKWDDLIEKSKGSNFYSFSWYLDSICDCWNAMILGDYEYVFPIPTKNKGIFKIAYQPFFSRQGGIISTNEVTNEIVQLFLKHLPKSYLDLNLGFSYQPNIELERYTVKTYQFQALSLDQDYPALFTQYSSNTKRILKKLNDNGITVREIENQLVSELFKHHTSKKINQIKEKDLMHLEKLFTACNNHQAGVSFGAYSTSNELLAAAFFVKHGNTICYLKGASTPLGKTHSAMFGIMNEVIKSSPDNYTVLDFGGSRITSIANFFKKFGAIDQNYLFIQKNPSFLIHLGKRFYKKLTNKDGTRFKSIK